MIEVIIMCEKCLSRTNCQFLGTHKNVSVEGCTAFRDEEEYVAKIKAEAIKEYVEKVKKKSKKRVSDIYGARVYIQDLDQIAKEMGVEL